MIETKTRTPDFASILSASARVGWGIDDVLPPDTAFDFERPFLPEALVRTAELESLGEGDRLALNHLRAHAYLAIFGLVEEFILPFVLDELAARRGASLDEQRALLGFAEEEAKHIELFRRFRKRFQEGFGDEPEVIGPPEPVARHVLAHHPLGVGLLILHIEWMTQRHYVSMVRGQGDIEPRFASLLHHHWLEECQHAKLDGFIVQDHLAHASPGERVRGLHDYFSLVRYFDAALAEQARLDQVALARMGRAAGTDSEREAIVRRQHASMRDGFLIAGLSHPRVLAILDEVHPRARVEAHRLTLDLC